MAHRVQHIYRKPSAAALVADTDLDVFIPELGYCEPRPWHEELPMTPRRWASDTLGAWEADIVFDVRLIW